MKLAPILLWATALFVASALRYVPRGDPRPNVLSVHVPLDDIGLPNDANQTFSLRGRRVVGIKALQPITDQAWENLRNRGCNLLRAMAATDKEAAGLLPGRESAESPFQKYPDDLTAWGYIEEDGRDSFKYTAPVYEEAFRFLGLNPDKDLGGEDGHGPNKAVCFDHFTKTKHDDVDYEPTGAIFRTIVNVQDGCMIGWVKYGAAYMGRQRKPPVTVLPKLKNWSDIAFLSWKSQGGGGALRYVWSAMIQNSEFAGIIGRALHEEGSRSDPSAFDQDAECRRFGWKDRKEINMDTDAGKALLGSPNGRGVGYLLVEHKSTFGERATANKVTFYCAGEDLEYFSELTLIFHVVPGSGGNDNKRPDENPHEKPPEKEPPKKDPPENAPSGKGEPRHT